MIAVRRLCGVVGGMEGRCSEPTVRTYSRVLGVYVRKKVVKSSSSKVM